MNIREHAMTRATSIVANRYIFLKRAIIVLIQPNIIVLKNKQKLVNKPRINKDSIKYSTTDIIKIYCESFIDLVALFSLFDIRSPPCRPFY